MSRKLCAAVCLLAVWASGPDALAQPLGQNIIGAEQIDADMRAKIGAWVAPHVQRLTAEDPELVSEARRRLTDALNNPNATPAFVDALSEALNMPLTPAITHKSVQVRMSAQIVLARMTDDKSKGLIDNGLEDDNVAVQRWAMEALAGRVKTWKAREQAGKAPANLRQKLDAVIKQVVGKLDQNPHPIVVTPGYNVLLAVDSPEAREALNDQLNKRVALHAQDPSLSYAPEQSAIGAFASRLAIESPYDQKSATGLTRAAFRYAVLIHNQLKAGDIKDGDIEPAKNMLGQCVFALGQVAAGARKNAPANQGQANNWIADDNWDAVQGLLANDWAVILRAAPFNLANEDLGL
ncbi:MAG: hypothetical protein ACE37H_03035 [Phycisphaeraceae bacterium]